MAKTSLFTARVEVTERHERAVIALFGMPSRPVIIPLCGVDLEPDGERHFRVTMDQEAAKDCGLVL